LKFTKSNALSNNTWIKYLKKSLLTQIKLTAIKFGIDQTANYIPDFPFFLNMGSMFTYGSAQFCLSGSCPTSTLLASWLSQENK
jgi:hypothetical protein